MNGTSIAMTTGYQNERATSVFDNVQPAPPDAILGLNTLYRADPSPSKVNLGVGAYRTDEGLPLVLPVVKKVERRILKDTSSNHEYLPQDGLLSFTKLAEQLILGEDSPAINENRVYTIQSLSGTGAIKLCLEFASKGFLNITANSNNLPYVYVPSPTWPNHQKIVLSCRLPPAKDYRYFNHKTGGVDIDGMKEDLVNAPPGSIIILHSCAHNPTGADLKKEEWDEILNIIKTNKLVPLFDSAYQGFASGNLDEDAYAIRLFARSKIDMFVSQSFAKNMGLYGERVGALTVVCKNVNANNDMINNIKSQLKQIARSIYSSPPLYGAKIVTEILSNQQLYNEWKMDLKSMSNRINEMRVSLKNALVENDTPGNWDHVTNQIGMFSFTGLTKQQVLYMRENHSIYMALNGRISLAGLTSDTVKYVADAMKLAIITHPKDS
uniref:Aspartate aminotransferase n=1 Tax=Symphyocladia latiuscula TaxID=396806 RepID=A0A097IUX6_9FLOR|nr:aspartate aminotransferase [Symphyocladia latiuscula]